MIATLRHNGKVVSSYRKDIECFSGNHSFHRRLQQTTETKQ